MQIHPLHNFISAVGTRMFLNIFTKGTPYYFLLLENEDYPKGRYTPSCTFEELYQYIQEEEDHKYIMQTSATTPEEVRRLHPELFI